MYNDSGFSTTSLRGTDTNGPPPIFRISMMNLFYVIVQFSVYPIVSKIREVMKSKAQTAERLGRPGMPWITERSAVWNAAIRSAVQQNRI